MYTIWYLFEKNNEKHLFQIIEKLNQEYSSPNFLHHITVYGLVDIKFDKLEKIILSSIKEIVTFSIEKEDIFFQIISRNHYM
jgi:hypothetical protein